MTITRRFFLFAASIGLALPSAAVAQRASKQFLGAAATVHPQATQAALDTFRRGGNAVDAAVSAALTLNVVNGYNAGIGGGCFILIRRPDGTLVAVDGRETAPAAATRDMFLRNGKADPELSRTGPLASGVPGALAAYRTVVDRFGRRPLSEPLQRAADVAELGFIVDTDFVRRMKSAVDDVKTFPATRAVLLHRDGAPYAAGELLRQPDLARTFRMIADQGTDWFYRGEFAERCAAWMREHGGILTAADFESYNPVLREPVVSTYRGYQIVGFPPPSSGGIHVAQILNILETFDLADLSDADRIHVMAEAMKLAFADRAYWLGDADFTHVPRGLISKEYARALATRIDLSHTVDVEQHGTPPGADEDWFGGRHTTHLTTVDAAGNWVAITATINTTFGSKVIVPGTGVVLNNEMDDFSAQPGVPNAFGLLGAEANCVEPGKRPLSSMSPTIVLKDGKPVFTCGAAGGPRIITQVLSILVRRLDLNMTPERCLTAPRFHHQWRPDELLIERSLPTELQDALKTKGHHLRPTGPLATCQAIGLSPDGLVTPASDPHVPGAAGVAWKQTE